MVSSEGPQPTQAAPNYGRPRMKLAILSHTLPPNSNGQAIMLGRLLENLDYDDAILIAENRPETEALACAANRLRMGYFILPPDPRLPVPRLPILRLVVAVINECLAIVFRAWRTTQIVRRERCGTIVACTGRWHEMPIAWWTARRLRLPWVAYIFDWYAEKYRTIPGLTGAAISWVAGLLEGPLLRRASAVIVPNETLRDEYSRLYGIEPEIVRNPTVFDPVAIPEVHRSKRAESIVRFTGNIYEAHYDALARLCQAIDLIHDHKVKLELFTNAGPDHLRSIGIAGQVESHSYLPVNEVVTVQRGADILFLPLAFDCAFPSIIRTSSPGKLGDYLVSGRPILVHAPADSFVAQYCKAHDCALVVDSKDPAALAEAVRQLCDDSNLTSRIIGNALERGRIDFHVETARQAFFKVLDAPACQSQVPRCVGTDRSCDHASPRVSVVVHARNCANLVEEAIDCVLAQDYPDIEVIVVYDGTTDYALPEFDRNTRQVRYVRQEHAGVGSARNQGIRHATGDFVAFLESDDLFLPHKLREQVECLLAHPEVALVSCWCQFEDAAGLRWRYEPRSPGAGYENALRHLVGYGIATSSVLLRRAVLDEVGAFDESMTLIEDQDLFARVARIGALAVLPSHLVVIRQSQRATTRATDLDRLLTASRQMLFKAFATHAQLGWICRRRLLAYAYLSTWNAWIFRHGRARWQYWWRSWSLYPISLELHLLAIVYVAKRIARFNRSLSRRFFAGARVVTRIAQDLTPPALWFSARATLRFAHRLCSWSSLRLVVRNILPPVILRTLRTAQSASARPHYLLAGREILNRTLRLPGIASAFFRAKGAVHGQETVPPDLHVEVNSRAPRPTSPRRLRVAFISPCLLMGGVEILMSGIVRLTAEAIDWLILVADPKQIDPELRAQVETSARVMCGLESARGIASWADIVIAWGNDDLDKWIDGFTGPVIIVAHGCGDFTAQLMEANRTLATHRVAVSRMAARSFAGNRVSIIPNGVDPTRCQSMRSREAIRREWGLEPTERAVGFVGRIASEKNPLATSHAVRALGEGYRAVYIGPEIKPSLRDDILQLTPDAIFVPPIHQIGDALQALDCLIMASPEEGFSLAAVEAMYVGIPIVATPVGIIPEMQEHYGPTTVMVPLKPTPADLAAAVREALQPSHRSIVLHAQQVVQQHFTVEAAARNWEQYLFSVMAAPWWRRRRPMRYIQHVCRQLFRRASRTTITIEDITPPILYLSNKSFYRITRPLLLKILRYLLPPFAARSLRAVRQFVLRALFAGRPITIQNCWHSGIDGLREALPRQAIEVLRKMYRFAHRPKQDRSCCDQPVVAPAILCREELASRDRQRRSDRGHQLVGTRSHKKRILFVAFSNSIHAVRWINQLSGTDWDLHLFPAYMLDAHPEFQRITTHYGCVQPLESPSVRNAIPARLASLYAWPTVTAASQGLLKTINSQAVSASVQRHWGEHAQPAQLAQVIERLRPDIIHSLEIQQCSYLTSEALRLINGPRPTYIVSNWGSDIYHFGRLPEHAVKIREVLSEADYYCCECERDVPLARQHGFRGIQWPVLPNAGGFHLDEALAFRLPGPISQRRSIMLKGYHGWAGRAIVGLEALARCANLLTGYRIHIYCAEAVTRQAAHRVQKETGLDIRIVPRSSHSELLRLHGESRMSIGLSISDGCSTSFLESLVMGSLPIQSFTACADEWVEDGVSGLLVPPEDVEAVARAIRRALTDDALVDHAAKINLQVARQRLDYANIQSKVLAMYDQVYSQAASPSKPSSPPKPTGRLSHEFC